MRLLQHLLAAWAALAPCVAGADVVVIINRTFGPLSFTTAMPTTEPQSHRVAPHDLVAVPVVGPLQIAFRSGDQTRQFRLTPNTAYGFYQKQIRNPKGPDGLGPVELQKIDLGGDEATARGTGLGGLDAVSAIGELPLRILVDEDEPAVRKVWEARLRKRVGRVSKLTEKYCRLRLNVVDIGTWNSDNRIRTFERSLREFESEVDPHPGMIAVGFTSQYEFRRHDGRLGGTRGPLHTHILVREYARNVTEAERVEILLHELGHVLGAAHSSDADSVMRPALSDHRARDARFAIRFDPANTIAVNLVSQELRLRKVRRPSDFAPATQRRLRQIYASLEGSLPQDVSASQYRALISQAGLTRYVDPAARVVDRIRLAARSNADLPSAAQVKPGRESRRTGDALTGYYVRQAAWATQELAAEDRPTAFLLGLGLALDETGTVRKYPLLKQFADQVESADRRAERLQVMGTPAMRGRADLSKHFLLSAFLTGMLGPSGAEAAGMAKENRDMQQGSGFSFADLAADKAGITFAQSVLSGRINLLYLAEEFRVEYFLPRVSGLPEGLDQQEFIDQFGSVDDPRFQQVVRDIENRIRALPPYEADLDFPQQLKPQ